MTPSLQVEFYCGSQFLGRKEFCNRTLVETANDIKTYLQGYQKTNAGTSLKLIWVHYPNGGARKTEPEFLQGFYHALKLLINQ